jgi:hypothetical protein
MKCLLKELFSSWKKICKNVQLDVVSLIPEETRASLVKRATSYQSKQKQLLTANIHNFILAERIIGTICTLETVMRI